jgi:glycine/D-amino acid oxidase-like deaminating enzyme
MFIQKLQDIAGVPTWMDTNYQSISEAREAWPDQAFRALARQPMLLDFQRAALLANGAVNLAHRLDDGNTEDFKPVVKLFNPCGAATWLLSELDEDGDTAFGLCDLGLGEPEIGYVSLEELASIDLRFGLYIERDSHFNATKMLSEYAAEARRLGRIEVC